MTIQLKFCDCKWNFAFHFSLKSFYCFNSSVDAWNWNFRPRCFTIGLLLKFHFSIAAKTSRNSVKSKERRLEGQMKRRRNFGFWCHDLHDLFSGLLAQSMFAESASAKSFGIVKLFGALQPWWGLNCSSDLWEIKYSNLSKLETICFVSICQC